MTERPGDNFPFNGEDIQIGDKPPEFNLFADPKKFNKPSGHERNGSKKQEDKEREFNFGISDKDFFDQSDKTPALKSPLLAQNTEKKLQKEAKETDEEQQEVSPFGEKFNNFVKNVKKIVAVVQAFFMSLGKDTLEFIAGFTGWKFLNTFIAKIDFTKDLTSILKRSNGIPLIEGKLDNSTLDALFNRYQQLQRSRIGGILPQQFVHELKQQSPVKEKLAQRIPVTGEELTEAASAISDIAQNQVADAEMNVMEFSGQLHDVLESTDFKHITAQEADYTDLLTQYKIAKRNHRNLTVREFVSAILNQPSIKAKRPQDVTIEDFRREAPIVVRERFSSTVTVKVTAPPRGNDTAKTNLPEKPQGKEA